nr:zinc finger, CCHC-type [Tanacetum cinerariifolium]
KDAICHQCGEVGHWRKNYPMYLAELMKKKKLSQGASTSGIFTTELYFFPSESWIYDAGCGTYIYITTQGLQGSKKLKQGALSLYVGDGHRAAVEAIETYHLELPSGLVIVLNNYHYALYYKRYFKKEVENQLGKTIKSLCFDRGGEYMSQEFLDHLKEHGIITHHTHPYMPQHNGMSERRNQTFLDMVRSMMSQTTLPKSFWDYALETAARILNMVPTKKVDKKPYEIWHGKAPKLSYRKVWGCEALVKRDTLTKPDKLDPRSFRCIFVGYRKETMGYSFYIPSENKVFVSWNAEFFENDLIDSKAKDDQEINEPQSDVNPIRKSSRTRRASYRMCLYIDVEEHELGDLGEPANYKVALLDPESKKWLDAMNVKMKSMNENDVWVLVELPPNARTVAKSFTQTYGVDYEETFSLVADIRAIRILIAIVAYYDYEIWQIDVKTAFLNGHLIKEVYMEQPKGFVNPKYHNHEAVWIRNFISGLGIIPTIEEPINMYCDNTGSIAIAKDDGVTKGARHFHAKVHYLRETIKLGDMTTSVENNLVFRSFFEKQKLTGSNFIDWYKQLRLVLLTEDKENYIEHPIPEAPAAPPGQQVPPAAATTHASWVKGQKEVDVLMLLTMDLDIQRNQAHLGAYDMLQELKAMFSKQAEQELLQTVKEFHACKQKEVRLILVSLNKDYDSFVQNYNMDGMGKTVNELHAMLKLHEDTLQKKDANPALHAIRVGRVQKNQKNKPHKAAKGGYGKGKGKMDYAPNNAPFTPKSKTPPPPKKDNPAKDAICHQCGEVGHWRRNCPVYLVELMKNKKLSQGASTSGSMGSKKLKPGSLSLYVGDGHRAAVEAIETYHLELHSGLVIVLNNFHYAPSITRGVISVLRFLDDSFINRFDENIVILVSKNNLVYFMAVLWDGIFEIDMSCSYTNDSSMYDIINKRAKINLDSSLLWHCRLGHISKKRIEKLQHDGLLKSIDIDSLGKTRRALDRMCLYIDAEEHELGDLSKPANYKAALLDPKSKKLLDAMNVKMQSMKDNDVWVLFELPPNARTIDSKVDYEETFSPVADIRAIRILIAIAAYYDYEILQMDVKTAFLNGHLTEEVYMKQPEGL